MSNSREIAKNLVEKMMSENWTPVAGHGSDDFEAFEEFVRKVLAYELSEAPDDFDAEPELQFP